MNKQNEKKLAVALKKRKVKGAPLNESQLVALLIYSMSQTRNEELASFATAITKGILNYES